MTESELDQATVERLHEESRAAFESQIDRLREIDSKAIEILKANLLLIGIFVTGASILVQTGIDVTQFVNIFTGFAAGLLLVSTIFAGVTYTASNLRGGIDGQSVATVLGGSYPDRSFEIDLLRSYGHWIGYNSRVTAINDMLISVTILLVIDAFVFLVAGIASSVANPGLLLEIGAFLVLAGLTMTATYRVYSIDDVGIHEEQSIPFEGMQLSKGASREEGHAVLRQLLAGEGDAPAREIDDP